MSEQNIMSEGSTRTKGSDAIINNINSISALAEIIKTTLGPYGMDKMLIDSVGETLITNDGVQILKSMDIEHPAAQLIVEVAKNQDQVVGDGTTSCILLISQMLQEAKQLYLKGIHPNIIVQGFTQGLRFALEKLPKHSIDISSDKKKYLNNIIQTAMRGKSSEKESPYLSQLLIDTIEKQNYSTTISKKTLKRVKLVGPSITSSQVVSGVVFDKKRILPTMPKNLINPNILIISCPIEVQEIENSHQIQISNYQEYEKFITSEKQFLHSVAQKIIDLNVKAVFCQKGVDDSVVSYLASKGVLVLRRCRKSDIEALANASNAPIISTLDEITINNISSIEQINTIEFDKEELISCHITSTEYMSVIVCGSTQHIVDEIERAIEDATGDISNVLQSSKIVGGGGSVMMAIYLDLLEYSKTKTGREQLIIEHLAESFLIIPKTLLINSGRDEIEHLAQLKSKFNNHNKVNPFSGIDCYEGVIENVIERGIIEPIGVSEQILKNAQEAITMLLRIDDIIAAKKISKEELNTNL
ncbi:MAG: thermosome subunit alpha [Candidatus Nanoarchaeia archaeon]